MFFIGFEICHTYGVDSCDVNYISIDIASLRDLLDIPSLWDLTNILSRWDLDIWFQTIAFLTQ